MLMKNRMSTVQDSTKKSVTFESRPSASRRTTAQPVTVSTRRTTKEKDSHSEDYELNVILTPTASTEVITANDHPTPEPVLKSILVKRDDSPPKLLTREPDPENNSNESNKPTTRIKRGHTPPKHEARDSSGDVLLKFGFTPKSILHTDDGRTFVKTISPTGSVIYVDVNDKTLDYPSNLSEVTVMKADEDFIPVSIKRQAQELMLPDVIGAVVDCPDGLCILDPKTSTDYKYSSVTGLLNYDAIRITPIVLLSDIQLNKRSVIIVVDAVLTRIMNSLHIVCIEDLDHFDQQHQDLVCEAKTFFKRHDDILAGLIDQNKRLKNSIKPYVSKEALPADENYQYLRNQLEKNEEMMLNMFKYTTQVGNHAMKLQAITNDLKTLITVLNEDFKEVN
ncbi:Hypothetical protein POVR1_LOCUS175 [uncultured virus]|nr:Hypothetical protein POVR1_LOCUS175 [uncultured virus]